MRSIAIIAFLALLIMPCMAASEDIDENGTLTTDNVTEMFYGDLYRAIDSGNVTIDGGEVDIFVPEIPYDMTMYMVSSSIFVTLFKDPRIDTVTVSTPIRFVDKYGYTRTELGQSFTMKSTTAAKINWSHFEKYRYNTLDLDKVADHVYTHPDWDEYWEHGTIERD